MAADRITLPLRIVMVAPPPDVAIAMQKGSAELARARRVGDDLVFDFEIFAALGEGERPRLLGPFVQGPPAARFVYVNSGTYAGEAASPWGRRAKVPLGGIASAMVRALKEGQRLEARFPGKAKDGGPAAASVPLLAPGWRPVPQ
jgi:hypothetical protein